MFASLMLKRFVLFFFHSFTHMHKCVQTHKYAHTNTNMHTLMHMSVQTNTHGLTLHCIWLPHQAKCQYHPRMMRDVQCCHHQPYTLSHSSCGHHEPGICILQQWSPSLQSSLFFFMSFLLLLWFIPLLSASVWAHYRFGSNKKYFTIV